MAIRWETHRGNEIVCDMNWLEQSFYNYLLSDFWTLLIYYTTWHILGKLASVKVSDQSFRTWKVLKLLFQRFRPSMLFRGATGCSRNWALCKNRSLWYGVSTIMPTKTSSLDSYWDWKGSCGVCLVIACHFVVEWGAWSMGTRFRLFCSFFLSSLFSFFFFAPFWLHSALLL
jgi:hypothetical protein